MQDKYVVLFGNILGSPFANLMGTHWEQNKNPKNSPTPTLQTQKEKTKLGPLEGHVEPSHWVGAWNLYF
jgi:hypothetical protein